MPIVIVTPTPADPIGIGLNAFVDLDPLLFLDGDQLAVTIQDGAETQRVIGFGLRSQIHNPFSVDLTIGQLSVPPNPIWQAYPQWPHASQGDTVRVVWQHQRSDATVVDQLVTQHPYDTVTGLQVALPNLIRAQGTGYSQADRDRDIKTSAAVLSAFPLTDLISEIAEIGLDAQFGCPPLSLLIPSATSLLNGSGTVDRPQGATGVNAYGFTFTWSVVPPGLSVIDGRALEYPERLAQFLVIRVDAAGNEYVADRYEFHHDQERVCWGIPFPKRLEYSILPGVSILFRWLLFPVGQ